MDLRGFEPRTSRIQSEQSTTTLSLYLRPIDLTSLNMSYSAIGRVTGLNARGARIDSSSVQIFKFFIPLLIACQYVCGVCAPIGVLLFITPERVGLHQ